MWPLLRARMCGSSVEDQLHRAEVVELDRALEVVEAVVAERDRAADRAARVVDEHVDRRMVREHLRDELLDRLGVGDVRRVDVRAAAELHDLVAHVFELVGAARDEQRDPAGARELDRGRAADPARRAGDEDRLAVHRALERAVGGELVGVEVRLPVLPQHWRVRLQLRAPRCRCRRARAPSPPSRRCGIRATWSTTSSGIADLGEQAAAHGARAGQAQQQRARGAGGAERQLVVELHRDARRAGRARERVDDLGRALRARAHEVERASVEPGLVRDVVHRRGDVVDRHDVRVAQLGRRRAAATTAARRRAAGSA